MMQLTRKTPEKFYWVFISILIGYILYHLATLNISPLPWFDELYFVNITNNFSETGKFIFDLYPWRNPPKQEEVLTYGPIYFYLTDFSWNILGKGIFQFRIVNFFFGALSIMMLFKIAQLQSIPKHFIWLAITLIITDPVLIQNSHSGRMDLVAFFFITFSLFLLLQKSTLTIGQLIVSGTMGVLALLTTPRVFFLLAPLGLILIFRIYQTKASFLKCLIAWVSPFVILYGTWIFTAFGGFTEYIDHYTSNKIITGHWGGNLNITSFQYPLILTTIFSIFIIVFNKAHKNLFFIFSILSLFLFYWLIYDYGLYNAMVLPFSYLLIVIALNKETKNIFRLILSLLTILLFIINIGVFAVKNTVILSTSQQRNTRNYAEMISKYIPENAKVVGDDRYYYVFLLNGNKYQSIEEGNIKRTNINKVISYQKNSFDFDYFIISNESQIANPDILSAYQIEYKLLKIQEIKTIETKSQIKDLIDQFTKKILGHKVHGSLNGTIYKVIK
jgi:hypothetical protein